MFGLSDISGSLRRNDASPKDWAEFAIRSGDSEFKIMLDTLRTLGVPHMNDWQPCRGTGEIGKDDKLQQAVIDMGHNFTTHATTGIQIGDTMLVFFTGGSGNPADNGAYVFSFDVKTREVKPNTKGRKIRCVEAEPDIEDEMDLSDMPFKESD